MKTVVTTTQLLVLSGCFSALVAQDDAKVNFEKDVYPFLEKSCVDCHKAPYTKEGRTKPTNPKAELRFDSAFGIVKGSDEHAVVEPGNPEKSSILQRTLLDEDHDDFMPPKGDPLTDEQKKILEKWIKEGADFGDWKGNQEAGPDDAKDAFEKK